MGVGCKADNNGDVRQPYEIAHLHGLEQCEVVAAELDDSSNLKCETCRYEYPERTACFSGG